MDTLALNANLMMRHFTGMFESAGIIIIYVIVLAIAAFFSLAGDNKGHRITRLLISLILASLPYLLFVFAISISSYPDGNPWHTLGNLILTLLLIGVSIFLELGVFGFIGNFKSAETKKAELLKQQEEAQKKREKAARIAYEHSPEYRFKTVVEANSILPADPDAPEFQGYKLVLSDNGGQPDPLYQSCANYDLTSARREYKLFGTPGVGLETSDFDNDNIRSGARGELLLAKMLASQNLNVVTFWSLYGFDQKGQRVAADIDCVILGITEENKVCAWFVDAKNYKGGSDTKYVNVADDTLARISVSQHAFIAGINGRPDLKLSNNMQQQRANWKRKLDALKVENTWEVCIVPTGENGTPDVTGVTWPGDIPATTPAQLIETLKTIQFRHPSNIPANVLKLFQSDLKQGAKH